MFFFKFESSFSKRLISILLFLLTTTKIQATDLEVRVGGFIPQSHLFREIYGTVIPSYQLEASYNLFCDLKAWGNVAYTNASGCSVPLCTKTRIRMVPISFGLKAVYPFLETFEVSAGGGGCFTWLKEINDSGFIPRSNTVHGFGAIIKTSLSKQIRCLRFSLFADYVLLTTHAENSTGKKEVDLSGFVFGCAVGGVF